MGHRKEDKENLKHDLNIYSQYESFCRDRLDREMSDEEFDAADDAYNQASMQTSKIYQQYTGRKRVMRMTNAGEPVED